MIESTKVIFSPSLTPNHVYLVGATFILAGLCVTRLYERAISRF